MRLTSSFRFFTFPRALLAALLVLSSAWAQSRTGWEMHQGEGVVPFGVAMPEHGATNEYDFATIPPAGDPGWTPAPNVETIAFDRPSTLCETAECLEAGDFTYFQTFVHIPSNVVLTAFTISFIGIDDGVRVTIFNSAHPGGVVVEGSYVFLGGNGTADLAALVRAGETNRVVVTHVDDCCSQCRLEIADVLLNGTAVAGPSVLSIYPASEVVEVGWFAHLGRSYQLQWATSPDSSTWSDLGTPVPGDGSGVLVRDSTTDLPQKFYRLLVLPE